MVGRPRHYPIIHLTPPLGSHTRPLREDPETRDETRPASPRAPLPLVPRSPPNSADNHRRGTPADRSGQSPHSGTLDAPCSTEPRLPHGPQASTGRAEANRPQPQSTPRTFSASAWLSSFKSSHHPAPPVSTNHPVHPVILSSTHHHPVPSVRPRYHLCPHLMAWSGG